MNGAWKKKIYNSIEKMTLRSWKYLHFLINTHTSAHESYKSFLRTV